MAATFLRQESAAKARVRLQAGKSFRLRVMACGIMVVVIAFIFHAPALKNGFVNWDDGIYVYENGMIQSLQPDSCRWMLTSFHATNWHPLTWLSHAVDRVFFGLHPRGHHLTSILLHGCNTLLVLLLAIVLCLKAQARPQAPAASENPALPVQALIAGCVTAVLFGVHPLRVESVAWIAERKDVLCAFFFLLTLLSYCLFVSCADAKKRAVWFATGIALAAAALMAKPMAVTLPFILLLLDIYPFKRFPLPGGTHQNAKVVLEKIPFLLLSGISAILTVMAQRAGGAFESLERLPFHLRLANALYAPLFYLGKMVWPAQLVPYYPFPKTVYFFDLAYYCIAIIVVLGITGWCIRLWQRGNCLLLTAWTYYLITLSPVVGIIQVGSQAAADRYTYLPSVSIFLLAGAGIAKLCVRFAGRKNLIVAGGLLAALLAAALGQRTIAQSAVWQDSESLWTYVIKAFPGRVPVAHNNLGVLYDGRGLHDKALEEYEKAIAINPAFADARANLGVAYKRRGNYEKAIEEYQKALAANPNMAEARTNLGLAYYHQGRYDKAVAEYQKALNIDPLLAAAYYNLGLAYIAQGLDDQALEAYKKALAINSALADAHYALGLIYYSKKNYTAAKMHFDKAQELGYKIDPKLREFFKQAP
jgi:tetratricopeptide (TPR) repeat protein